MERKALVGGTVIDGTGKPPLERAVVTLCGAGSTTSFVMRPVALRWNGEDRRDREMDPARPDRMPQPTSPALRTIRLLSPRTRRGRWSVNARVPAAWCNDRPRHRQLRSRRSPQYGQAGKARVAPVLRRRTGPRWTR